jgi:ribosomal protein L37E
MKLDLKNLKLSGASKYGLILVGGALVLYILLQFLGAEPPKKIASKEAKDDKNCPNPNCRLPLNNASRAAGKCAACGQPLASERDTSAGVIAKWIPVVLVTTFCILLVVNAVFLVRNFLNKGKGDDYLHINCRKCERKIRYRLSQSGQLARCPNPKCKVLVRFPEAEKPPTRWSRMRTWLASRLPKKKKKDAQVHQED